MRWRRVRIELERALQFRIRAGEVPVEDTLRFAQVAMRFSILFVERKRLQGCFFRCRVSFEWFYVDIGQKIPNLRDPSPGTRKCRIFLERALKETERPPQILFAALVREKEALQIEFVCLRVPLFMDGKGNGELNLERIND